MKLKKQVKRIQKHPNSQEVNKLNSMILGMHNYYNMATNVNIDFGDINFIVTRSIDIRLRTQLSNKPIKSKTYQKFYKEYDGRIRTLLGITLFPIYGVKNLPPMAFTQEINNYTPQGRELIHKKLSKGYTHLIRYLLDTTRADASVEYRDNSISLLASQKGLCYVTGKPLIIGEMECHHKTPKHLGGTDEYKNLVWVSYDIHKLIHATDKEITEKYMNKLELNKDMIKKINSLRKLVANSDI